MTKYETIQRINAAICNDDLGAAERALEEYAKQDAVGFAKFAMLNTFQDMNVLNFNGHEDKWGYGNDIFPATITNEQLFDLYQQSKQTP